MIKSIVKLARISHWIKNTFIFVPLIFSKHLLEAHFIIDTILAFFAFSFISSSIYVINDIFDRELDKKHPKKSKRPIASGAVSINAGISFSAILFLSAGLIAYFTNYQFQIVIGLYFILNFAYSIKLKRVVLIDLLIIASGFLLRILAGAFVIDVMISKWLILTTLFISLFLAVMKRKSEMNLDNDGVITRFVLMDYSDELINLITSVSVSGVIICYALYTVSDRTVQNFGSENLVFTILFVLYGVFRYTFLVYKKNLGENVVETILNDKPMIVNSLLYVISVILIIYLYK